MGIINELLKEIKSDELDIQLKEICDNIINEEKDNFQYQCVSGPNVFLSLPCKGNLDNEIGCLCLEREFQSQFIVSFWTRLKTATGNFKKIKVWESTKFIDTPEKILKFYAERLKCLKGDI